jgi:tetratricopeptide (TPR) repeat protein
MRQPTPVQTPSPVVLPRRWLWIGIAAFLGLLILIGFLTQGRSAVLNPSPPTPVPAGVTADDALIQAREANIRADIALDSVDKILGILQAMGIVVAIATAVIAVAGYRTSREFSEEMDRLRLLESNIQKALDDVSDVRHLLEQVETTQRQTERLRAEVGTSLAELRASRDELNANLREVDDHINNVYKAGGLSQLAQRQIALGNLVAAARVFRDVCALDPGNPIYQYFLGDLLMRQGFIEEGIQHLRTARQDNYKYPSADASYAYALRLRGDAEQDPIQRESLYYESGEIFLGVYQVDPELVDISGESVFGALAGLYRRQGRYETALQWYEHCRRVTPHNSYPVNNLAALNFYLGNYEESRKYFKRSLSIANEKLAARSSDYWARFDLVTARAALGESIEALADELEKLRDVAVGPLQKFLYGFEQMRAAKNPPPDVILILTQVVEHIKADIASRTNPQEMT